MNQNEEVIATNLHFRKWLVFQIDSKLLTAEEDSNSTTFHFNTIYPGETVPSPGSRNDSYNGAYSICFLPWTTENLALQSGNFVYSSLTGSITEVYDFLKIQPNNEIFGMTIIDNLPGKYFEFKAAGSNNGL